MYINRSSGMAETRGQGEVLTPLNSEIYKSSFELLTILPHYICTTWHLPTQIFRPCGIPAERYLGKYKAERNLC